MEKVAQILKGEKLSGAESHVYDLSEKLIENGKSAHVINIFDESNRPPRDTYINRIESVRDKGAHVYTVKSNHKFDPRTIPKIRNIINQVGPDIVHTHMPYADLFGGVAARLAGHTPIVSTRHHDYMTSWSDWLRFVCYYAVAGRFLDRLISVSSQVASQARAYEWWSEDKIHVVHHGCRDESRSQNSSREEICSALGVRESCTILLSVGRLLEWKGHQYAVRALRHLRDEQEKNPFADRRGWPPARFSLFSGP